MFLASTSHLPKTRRTRDIWISVVSLLTLIAVLRSGIQSQEIWPNGHLRKTNESNADDCPDVDLVVASQMKDNTTWLHDSFADWRKLIYVTNDPNATFTVPSNKGREGMVYLTYIINNYDNLADIIIFLHANRYQWHNDDPLYDGLRVLSRLHLSHVLDQGYANLRCVWTLGCPSEIRPLIEAEAASPASDPASNQARAGSFYKSAFEELFPDIAVPDVVAAACCAQFAVTANKIRQRPRNDYERFRMWLLRSELNDDLAGRIMEYSWHILFGQDAVFCPSAQLCYCQLYGLCNLTCDEGICPEYYTLPITTDFPPGWPTRDRDGQWRNTTQMEAEYNQKYPL